MGYFVYILECSDNSLYTGYTDNLEKRVLTHNNLKSGAKYTKTRRPVVLKYFEKYKTKSEAMRRENQIKKLSRDEKLALIKGIPPVKMTVKEKRDLCIKKSINGFGIFSIKNFDREDKIFQVTGTFITCDEKENIDKKTRDNTYRYDENLYISPKGKIGDLLNHSCNPNSKIVKIGKKLYIVAINSIPKNKEILIDYSTLIANDDIWKMKCNCKSKNCRIIIKKFISLPQIIKQKYLALGMVPNYILK